MRVRLLVLCWILGATASAAPLPLPQGARWLVSASSAAQFARDGGALLEQAGKHSSALGPRGLGAQLEGTYALPLVDAARLEAAGLDVSQPWLLFETAGGTYLTASVRDPVPVAALIEQWAQKRSLKREEVKLKDPVGTSVTFSRSAGARPVTGYFIARGRLIMLVTPADRSAGLRDAWVACEEAAPIAPPMQGTLLVWLGNGVPLRDAWLAVTIRPDGIDLKGLARTADRDWITRDPTRVDWLRALTVRTEGLPGDAPARLRFAAGPRASTSLTESLIASGNLTPTMEKWIASLATLGAGPVEATAQSVDLSALQSGSSGDLRTDLLRVTRPQIQLVDRPVAAVAKRFESATNALCGPSRKGADAITSTCPATPLTVSRTKGTLALTWGRFGSDFEVPAPRVTPTAMSCSSGVAVASARLDLAAVFRGTKGVGFLDALSNDALAGVYAFVSQYGQLMKASQPAVGLVCEEKDGKLTLDGSWRFAPR